VRYEVYYPPLHPSEEGNEGNKKIIKMPEKEQI